MKEIAELIFALVFLYICVFIQNLIEYRITFAQFHGYAPEKFGLRAIFRSIYDSIEYAEEELREYREKNRVYNVRHKKKKLAQKISAQKTQPVRAAGSINSVKMNTDRSKRTPPTAIASTGTKYRSDNNHKTSAQSVRTQNSNTNQRTQPGVHKKVVTPSGSKSANSASIKRTQQKAQRPQPRINSPSSIRTPGKTISGTGSGNKRVQKRTVIAKSGAIRKATS